MEIGIYQVRNILNGKLYVGSTVRGFEKRWQEHRMAVMRGKGCPLLRNAMKKYGAQNFVYEILETVANAESILQREQYWIDKLNTIAPNGYNLCPKAGSRLGSTQSEETRRKISEANTGLVKDEEWRRKLSESKKGISTGPSKKKGRRFIERACPICKEPVARPKPGEYRETCGKPSCRAALTEQKGGGGASRRGTRSIRPCPVCGNPRKECYTSKGVFNKYQITCGSTKCVVAQRRKTKDDKSSV